MLHGLRDLRIIDFSAGIAGAYVTKLLADAGADVIKVESPSGDPLRQWSQPNELKATETDLNGRGSALFQFLNTSKKSVIGNIADNHIIELIGGADLVVESIGLGGSETSLLETVNLCERFPELVVLSISPYGLSGPYASRPVTEFILQAESGSLAGRGLATQPPIMAGGRITEWVGGTFAAVAALAAVQRAQQTGQGEQIDFSLLEVMNIAGTSYSDLVAALSGRPPLRGSMRSVEVPSIEPTADGWVGFTTNSRQQFNDFLILIERPDLLADEELAGIMGRIKRLDEWNDIVRAWTSRHTTAEIVERASLLRIPVAPVNNGATVFEHEHFKARGTFVKNPAGFLQPRSPYLLDGKTVRPFEPAPSLGEHSGKIAARIKKSGNTLSAQNKTAELPLKGIRVLDATAWWAGPSATQMLAHLGAEVIHLEAIQRMDGMRMTGGMFYHLEKWWERSAMYLSANSNKRGLTLDLDNPLGVEVAKRLIAKCDVFVENFSPRVVEKFGLDWPQVQALNPQTIMVRMPAFGLSGPWRDNVGFAQTMEQITGMAWLTGHKADQPRIQRGPCDPLAGMHAAFATLVALANRKKTGKGQLVECSMVEGALNAAAEQLVEYSAYGNILQRDGNRSATAAPQGLYACAPASNSKKENWLALSIETDQQWQAFKRYLGYPRWVDSTALDTKAGRRAKQDVIDTELSRFFADKNSESTVEALIAVGVPAGLCRYGAETSLHPQLIARNFYEKLEHPIVGTQPFATVPFRFKSLDLNQIGWLKNAAPLLGEQNTQILTEILGLSDAEIADLENHGIIGRMPRGV